MSWDDTQTTQGHQFLHITTQNFPLPYTLHLHIYHYISNLTPTQFPDNHQSQWAPYWGTCTTTACLTRQKDYSQGILTLFISATGVQHTHLSTCSASSGEITLIFWCDVCIHLPSTDNPKSTSGDSSEHPLKKEGLPVLTVGGINAIYLLYSCIIMKSEACRRQTSVSRKQVIAMHNSREDLVWWRLAGRSSSAMQPHLALHLIPRGWAVCNKTLNSYHQNIIFWVSVSKYLKSMSI